MSVECLRIVTNPDTSTRPNGRHGRAPGCSGAGDPRVSTRSTHLVHAPAPRNEREPWPLAGLRPSRRDFRSPPTSIPRCRTRRSTSSSTSSGPRGIGWPRLAPSLDAGLEARMRALVHEAMRPAIGAIASDRMDALVRVGATASLADVARRMP